MSESPVVHEAQAQEAETERRGLIEPILDNLTGWTLVALTIGLLYLIWATLEILSRYVGGIPEVTP